MTLLLASFCSIAIAGSALAQQQAFASRLSVPLAEVDDRVTFDEQQGEPKWLHKPEAAVDKFSFVTSHASTSAARAMSLVTDRAEDMVRDVLFEHLQPVFGAEQTLAVVQVMLDQTVLVDAMIGTTRLMPGTEQEAERDVACLCFRTPIRSVVEKFEPSLQGRIEWVLLRPIVHWQQVAATPAWADKVPARAGYFRCAFACEGRAVQDAQRVAADGRENVRAYLLELLMSVASAKDAAAAAAAGLDRLSPVAKVFEDRRSHEVGPQQDGGRRRLPWNAYCLWEVPTAPMLARLPKAARAKALAVMQN
jgi:hypothetical protein